MGRRDRTIGLMMIGGLILIALIVPYTRGFLLFQLSVGYTVKTMSNNRDNFLTMDTNRQSPRNVYEALAIASRDARKAKSLTGFERMIGKYPNEPLLYAYLLRFHDKRVESWGEPRPEQLYTGDDLRKPLGDTPDARMIEHAIMMGKKLEPDNGYFDYYEAALRFAQKRDSEALRAIHRAAGKQRFDSHSDDEVQARLISFRERAGDLLYWMRPMWNLAIDIEVQSQFWSSRAFHLTSSTAMRCIEKDARSGQTHRALSEMADIIALGDRIATNARWSGDTTHATYLQTCAINGAYKGLVDTNIQYYPSSETLNFLSAVQRKAQNGLNDEEWPTIWSQVAGTLRMSDRVHTYWGEEYKSARRIVVPNLTLLTVSGSLLFMMPMFGMMWLLAIIGTAIRGRAHVSVGPNRLSIWLIALLPPAAALAFLQGWYRAADYQTLPSFLVVQGVTAGLKVLMLALVLIIAAVGSRALAKGCRFDGFLARLGTGSMFAVQGLVILYLLSMIALVPITARANHGVRQFMWNEMQLVHTIDEQHP